MSAPRVAILAHGNPESIEAVRARGLSQGYPADKVHLLFREGSRRATATAWRRRIKELDPDLVYVINTALPGCPLAVSWKLTRGLPFILDTGDAVYAMARSAGTAPWWKLPLLRLGECLSHKLACTIVVRGTRHAEFLRGQGRASIALIRDGCHSGGAPNQGAVEALRERLGLGKDFVVGVMGSLVYSPRLGICYGWDLIQALARLRDLPVRGLVIGDGDGRAWLAAQAQAYGVADRVSFCGRIPYADVPVHLGLCDVALSTQTNNLAGQVRTTGKLPEYMAAGRFILASRVGEAALVLPESMLLDYHGEVDTAYPQRLADRLRELHSNSSLLEARRELPRRAEELFAYRVLAGQFRQVVEAAWGGCSPAPSAAGPGR